MESGEASFRWRFGAARMGLRNRAAESTIRIAADRDGAFAFENYIDGLRFVLPSEHSRLKLAGEEMLDNLIHHAVPLAENSVIARTARRGVGLFLSFYFKSASFAAYAARSYDHEPIFDHRARRWHGMGLRMTRNLSASLTFRPGSLCDRIILRF